MPPRFDSSHLFRFPVWMAPCFDTSVQELRLEAYTAPVPLCFWRYFHINKQYCGSFMIHHPDFISSIHTIYAYLTGLLLTLAGIKYQGSSTNPFSEHPTLMTLFLVVIFGHFIAVITLTRPNHMSDRSCALMVGVCHISGALACELVSLVLVSPMRWLLINMSSFAIIVMLVYALQHLLHNAEGAEEQASQMADLEAPAISTAS